MSKKRPGQDVRLQLTLAGEDFDAGRLASAAGHAASAVVLAPALPEAQQMLVRLARHPDGGRDLFPLTDPLALSTVVARAHVVAAEGDFGYALRLLGKAQAHAPETAWADAVWVTDPATAASVDPAIVTNLALDLLGLVRAGRTVSLRLAMAPYFQLIRNTITAHPRNVNLLGAASYLFRRFALDEAEGYATRADEIDPSGTTAIVLGYIYRDQGRTGDALLAWERALRHEPANLEVYADMADLLMALDRLDEALACTRRALVIDPAHACSQAIALAVQFCQTRQAAHLDALIELGRTQSPGSHASRHTNAVLQATVTKTASRTDAIRGSQRQVQAKARRFARSQPD